MLFRVVHVSKQHIRTCGVQFEERGVADDLCHELNSDADPDHRGEYVVVPEEGEACAA